MNITVDADWWKTLFDEVYLTTDARSVCNDEVTRREADAYCALLPMRKDDHILDLCGGHGRHSFELARRGYRHCTVLDYSSVLIEKGRVQAERTGRPVCFYQGDARNTSFEADSFDHVLILGNSMGYMPDRDGDLQILAESQRLLKPGGRLLVDVTDARRIRSRFSPEAWHEIGEDIVVCRQREIDAEVICVREVVLSKKEGLVRDRTYSVRLYEEEMLEKLAAQAGFYEITAHRGFRPHDRQGDYGCMNHRMLLIARKR